MAIISFKPDVTSARMSVYFRGKGGAAIEVCKVYLLSTGFNFPLMHSHAFHEKCTNLAIEARLNHCNRVCI